MSAGYLTVNAKTGEPRVYLSAELALVDSIRLNEADSEHPTFYLWHDGVKLGHLTRAFGTDDFSWK